MNIINSLRKKLRYSQYKPFVYTENVRLSYSGRSICGGILQGKNVLITGATGGIGEALVNRFIIEKANVYISGRDEKKVNSLFEKVANKYPQANVKTVIINNLELEDMEIKVDSLLQNHKIDILVNNSGVYTDIDRKRMFRGVSREQFYTSWITNYEATYKISMLVADSMNRRGVGNIINISSICAKSRKYMYTPYGITKGAILGIKKEIEDKYKNVVVNSILPGTVATSMNNAAYGDDIVINRNKIGRAALPEEIAAIVAWISSMNGKIKSECIIPSACEIL